MTMRKPAFALLLLSLATSCSSLGMTSEDSPLDYALSKLPFPQPKLIHSRFDRLDSARIFGLMRSRDDEWQFELVASSDWVETLRREFKPRDWKDVHLDGGLPQWFSPNTQAFHAYFRKTPSDLTPAELFIESAPASPNEVRVFVCGHTRVWGKQPDLIAEALEIKARKDAAELGKSPLMSATP